MADGGATAQSDPCRSQGPKAGLSGALGKLESFPLDPRLCSAERAGISP